jgi:hypothetical protein
MAIIKEFVINTKDIHSTGETRPFFIIGDADAVFSLEIKNEDGNFYNFFNNTFQANKIALTNKTVTGGRYVGNITFPAVSDADHYDISLFAGDNTEHKPFVEVRFADNSLDINSSTGSNSKLVQKKILQTLPIDLTISAQSINGLAAWSSSSITNATISSTVGRSVNKQSFTVQVSTAATKAVKIDRLPTVNDLHLAKNITIGSDPVYVEGEDVFPEARTAFTGDDVNGAITSGAVVRMDNTDLSAVIAVGDRVTTTATTDTVDGAITGGVETEKIVMDSNVATKMAVGDKITGTAEFDAGGFFVRSLNPDGDNAKEFRIGTEDGSTKYIDLDILDGATLTFTSKLNRTTTTVTVVETSGTATDFTMSQAIQLRDNAPLTFSPRKNYIWPVDNINNLENGYSIVVSGNAVAGSIADYVDSTTLREGLEDEELIIHRQIDGLDTVGKKATRAVNGTTNLVTNTQPGNIAFSTQQALALAGDTVKIMGRGPEAVETISGWKVQFSNLKVELTNSTYTSGTKPTTTTTGAVSGSATIGVADREGIIQNISTISGIGIAPGVVNPTITSTQADGAGNWTADVAQTLESGITLTIDNTSRFAIITGDIEVIEAGPAGNTVYFDLETFLTAG